MTKVLIIHTTLWSHYKARLYSELQTQINDHHLPIQLKVIQLAATERSRVNLSQPDLSLHQYDYTVLYQGLLEDFTFHNRLTNLINSITAYKPDILTIPGYYDPAVVLCALYARTRGCRIVMSIDSTAEDNSRKSWKENLKFQLLRIADGFFCYGSRSATYLKQLGVPASKILSARNAVDNITLEKIYLQTIPHRIQQQNQLQAASHNFIYVGRLIDKLKNISGLIQSFSKACHQNNIDSWGLLIVGDGQDEQALRAVANQYPNLKIKFIPGQSWQKIPSWLALADVLVLPSFSEPWGLVVNEAMACGMPAIVSDRCGCADDLITNGETGFAFDPYQPTQLEDALRYCMNHPEAIVKMGKTAKQRIGEYTPEKVADEMLDGFLRLKSV